MAVALTTSMNRPLRLASAMLAIAISLACEAQPRQRPLDVGEVASGTGTVEVERGRMQGNWGLERFEVIDSAGKPTPVRAEATLTYDEYGNLIVRGKLLEPMPGEKRVEIALLDYSGPIVVDPTRHQFRLGAMNASAGPIDPALESKIDPTFVRKYELTDTTLRISYVTATGNPTAVASFIRR